MAAMKVGIAQINTTVGDFAGNAEKILRAYQKLTEEGADLVLTPELSLTGYPPQDLVFKSRFVPENLRVLEELHAAMGEAALVVGFVDRNSGEWGRPFFNAVAFLVKGQPKQVVYKRLMPTYDVFDEARYFEPGPASQPIAFRGTAWGVTICEDLWSAEYLPRRFYTCDPLQDLQKAGAEAILNLSASPFQLGKPSRRLEMLQKQAAQSGLPIFYCNAVGGNDQLIFDGTSCGISSKGHPVLQLGTFREDSAVGDLFEQPPLEVSPRQPMADLHDGLVLGIRDYMAKCGFERCLLGLSGGIDSAITACLAVEAVGAERVMGVAMPGPYSSEGSVTDALALANNLGIRCHQISIGRAFAEVKNQFAQVFSGLAEDATEENLQSRIRGLTLMALSNKFGSLLLTTGNKSELAVGYCTIYGDMCGGLAVISDVPKTLVYALAAYVNRDKEWIPADTISKPPSAELRPNQTDQDTLPPYDLLDQVLALYVEENLSAPDIIARGFDEAIVRWIIRKVDLNEYKRKQAAPGLKVTGRAFGMGRRMPIAQRFVV